MQKSASIVNPQILNQQNILPPSEVNGVQVRESWLIHLQSIIDYRKNLFQSFKDSQQRYLQRRGIKRILNQQENPLPMNLDEQNKITDFHTVNPKHPNFALQKRKFIKYTRGMMNRTIERHFVMDDIIMTYFSGEKERDFKGHYDLGNAEYKIEKKDTCNGKWHESKKQFRVTIELECRQFKPIFYYSNDLNEVKCLAARIDKASKLKLGKLQKLIQQISLIDQINRFQMVWQKIAKVYDIRNLKMISFQMMGINLIELASNSWLQREKLLKYWSNQIIKRDKLHILKSSFRYGIIRLKRSAQYRSSLLVREQLRKLVNTVKHRRYNRPKEIQEVINEVIKQEKDGFKVKDCNIAVNKQGMLENIESQKIKDDVQVKIQENKYLMIEQLISDHTQEEQEDFYEKKKPLFIKLEDIGCIATDFHNKINSNEEEQIYKIRIYGRMLKENTDLSISQNVTTCQLDLDVPRRIPKELFIITVESIEMPLKFAQRFHQIADLRVRLRQAKTQNHLKNNFYIDSRAYKVESFHSTGQGKPQKIDCQNLQFVVDKLNFQDPNEVFTLSLLLSRNSVPIKQLMKDLLFQEEFPSNQEFKYEGKHQVKIVDKDKNEFVVSIKVEKVNNENNAIPQERAGKRLLVGKYVILDRKKQSRVTSFNRDGTTNIELISNKEKIENVTPNRLRLIENSGVNVYDISNLPHTIAKSEFAWAIQFTTREKRLLNTILTAIQVRATSMLYDFKSFKTINNEKNIQGQLFISIVQASNLHAKGDCNPYVQFQIDIQAQKQFQTEVEQSNNPHWINERARYGNLFDLGIHQQSDNGKKIKFEIKNKTQREDDLDLGTASIDLNELLDIQNIAKQISLIINNKERYGSLVIQSLFIPAKNTRMKYELQEDLTIFTYPEQFLHFQYLLKTKEFDSYGYQIPIAQYQPNNLQQLAYNIQQLSESLNSPLLQQSMLPDMTSSPLIIQHINKFCSYEEQLFKDLKRQNPSRPSLEEGILKFKHLWRYRVFFSRQVAKLQLQNQFWNHLMQQIQSQDGSLEDIDDIEIQQDILDQIEKRRQQNNNNIVGPLKNLFNTGQRQSCKLQFDDKDKQDKIVLLFRGIWNKGEQDDKYADVYYLIQKGIPSELRPTVWQDLLNVPVLEYQERKLFQKNYGMNYNKQKSLYQNFIEYSSIHDCLAFRQIDEDIKDYVFTKYYLQEKLLTERIIEFNEQKRKIRNILKATIMWSKNKTQDNKAISYCYTKGMLSITQRLLTICSEEQSFWILNGIIRSIPRLFSTSVSCLEGGRESVMRNEMTIFKAILKENLPEVCQKLQIYGLALDILIYDSITSFYSGYFSSEICLRIWDLIIFNLSNKEKEDRKRAIWQLLAPAYIVIRDNYEELLQSKSIKEIVQVYQRGCSISYNPEWIISEIKQVTKNIFVIGASKGVDTAISHRRGQSDGKYSLGDMFRRSLQYDRATLLETTRKNYEQDLSLIFASIIEENKEVGKLIKSINYQQVKGQIQYLNYYTWRTHIMNKFKRVAIKNGDEIIDELYQYDEPDLQRRNLDLSKVNIYLHQIQHLSGINLYKLRISYGNLEFDGTFKTIEVHSQQDVYSQQKLQQFHVFDYTNGYNHIKIELYLPSDYEDQEDIDGFLQVICETVIDLRDINANAFVKKWVLMSNEKLLDNPETFRFPFTKFEISFFLQSHTASQHEDMMHNRNVEISQFVNSIKRKLPDKIDVFNKKHDSAFALAMQGDFQRIIQEELNALKCFLPLEQAKNIINDMYNYIEDSDFGDIRYHNFEYLIEQCFFNEWKDKLQNVYKLFTKDSSNEEQKDQELIGQSQGGTQFQEMISKIKLQVLRSPRESTTMLPLNQTSSTKLPFSLRNFIVSLTLMSHCTLNEKLDILYDLFDWNDGVADGLDLNTISLLVNTIFERNLYYWSSHELSNLIEFSFDSDVSMIYQAYWSREIHINKNKKYQQLSEVDVRNINTDELLTIDVTTEVQQTINSYQHMFGNKIIDFNYDTSPFKNLEMLIKGGSKLAQINSNLEEGVQKYRLVLHCLAQSERFLFEVKYNSNGQLEKNRELIEKDDIDEYLKRNFNKLFLQGRTKGISKKEFLLKTAQIPFLQDLIRVETFYRDRVQNTLAKKKRFPNEILVLLTVDKFQFIFRFQPKVMANIDGEIDQIDSQTYRIKMTCLYCEDVLSDIRQRIITVLESLFQSNQLSKMNSFKHLILNAVKGQYEFVMYEQQTMQFKQVEEFDRIVQYTQSDQNQIMLKMVKSNIKEEELDQEVRSTNAFDCYSLYKHSDNTFEWRLCRITRKFPIKIAQLDSSIKFNEAKFHYWIEFLHLAEIGQKMWFKRKRSEILMSARYSREQKRNYQKEVLQFIKETYKK